MMLKFNCAKLKRISSNRNLISSNKIGTTTHLSGDKDSVFVVSTASRGIGLEFAKQLLKRTEGQVIALNRHHSENNTELKELSASFANRFHSVHVDLEDQPSIDKAAKIIRDKFSHVDLLLNVAAILGTGDDSTGPERSINNINRDWLQKSFGVNVIGHVMLTQALLPMMKSNLLDMSGKIITQPRKIVNISARVGSISDNYLGGWYSYRMSKAALNMFTKTLSLESKRDKTIVISLHPGTTDTDLSKPFQRNVKPEKLFSAEHSVNQMLELIWRLEMKDSGLFFAYDGSVIPF